jgi:SMI1/KNR4 family protein SUKH-1
VPRRSLQALLSLPGTRSEAPASPVRIADSERAIGASLPEVYSELLANSDGVGLLQGHLRLLGASELVRWNAVGTWKHAWPRPPIDMICFGGTSVGDQWAWSLIDLRADRDAPVQQLDGFELTRTQIAPDTDTFFEVVLPSLATTHVDDLLALALERLGPLQKGSLLAGVPPPQFGTDGLWKRLIPMPDSVVMTIEGDVVRQLAEHPGRPVTAVESVIDDSGRPRLKLLFGGG